jgi:hypothetical protein
MTAVAERTQTLGTDHASRPRRRLQWSWRSALPTVLAVLNGVVFVIVRPDVNDLWAARARASAARHGVGLTYWFGWFGGGSTPGSYSVLTPSLSALLTAEIVGALSAVAVTVLCQRLLRTAPHATAATYLAVFATGVNLWSGRVPFLLGAAFGIAALLAVSSRHLIAAPVLGVACVLGSPVSGAFLLVALCGTLVVSRSMRRVTLLTAGCVVVATGLLALAFGAPGPQPFSFALFLEVLGGLLLVMLTRPPAALRVVVYVSVVVTIALEIVPNGMGSNLARLVWFCLPVAAVALSRRRAWVAALLMTPIMLAGADGTVNDLRAAGRPSASGAYYADLAAEFDRLPQLRTFRVEVVAQGEHAAYDALLDHAMLARGWETQEDHALNQSVLDKTLDPVTYKVWLNNNAVGVVALPTTEAADYPEYTLVAGGLSYLTEIWHNADWILYQVKDPVPVVGVPATLEQHTQSRLTIAVPCACKISVRVRWSKFLTAKDALGFYQAKVSNDGAGWTTVTTTGPSTYYLTGSLRQLFG